MLIYSKPITAYNYHKGRFDIEKNPVKPDMVVIHVGEGSMDRIWNTFNNPAEQKSSHYIVSLKGEVWQCVREEDTAWTQGFVKNPTSRLIKERIGKFPNPNAYIISIENEGFGGPFTPEQFKANATLIADICKRNNIPLSRVHIIGHNEIRSDKTCPGVVSLNSIVETAGTNECFTDQVTIKQLKDKVLWYESLVTQLKKLLG